MSILSEDIGCQVVVRVLAVEKYQVGEGLLREWRVVQQEVQFFETGRCILLDVHQRGIMKGDWIEFILVPRWHVEKGFSGHAGILHGELNGCLEVEGLNQRSFFQCLGVTDRFNFDPF